MRYHQIAVIGYDEDSCTDVARKIAYETGKEIAKAGSVLLSGGLGGVMLEACKGAKDHNGTTVGIIPQNEFYFANKYCDIVICSSIGFARNFIIASSADGIIIVGGGAGTLNELAIAYINKKKIVALTESGGIAYQYAGKYIDDRKIVKILSANDPKDAVSKLLN